MPSIHSRTVRTRRYTTKVLLFAGGHGTASQRCTDIIHSPHNGQRKTARSQVFRFFLFLPLICKYLCFSATTSRLVSYGPSNIYMRKLTKAETAEEALQQRVPFIAYSQGETLRGRVGGEAGRGVELMN